MQEPIVTVLGAEGGLEASLVAPKLSKQWWEKSVWCDYLSIPKIISGEQFICHM